MGRELTDLSFEQWVKHVFDHQIIDPAWHFAIESEWWDYEPPVAVSYLTTLFSNPIESLTNYTDAQINQGFWYLVSDACSLYMRNLSDKSVPLIGRVTCIENIYALFEKLFATRCTPTLSHLNEKGNPINSICYMWWDIIQLAGVGDIDDEIASINRMETSPKIKEESRTYIRMKHTEDYMKVAEAVRDVMVKTLEIESDACRESALHGLGHWTYYYGDTIRVEIDEWLKRHPDVRPELRQYAERAKYDAIL